MRHDFISCIGSMTILLSSACGSESHMDLDLSRLNDIQPNDSQMNGLTLNGLTLNGLTLNGLTLNGLTLNSGAASTNTMQSAPAQPLDLANVRFATLTLNDRALTDGTINESSIEAKLGHSLLSGAQLIGAKLQGKLLNGTSIPLRIEDAKIDGGVTLYSISVLSDNGPMPLCGTAAGSPGPAIAVSGYWDKSASYIDDDDSFTFGCINAAIGKCVIWGYRPWATASECRNNSCRTRYLKDWQLACVRLVRADYCGDGIPHTRSGTRINVYDQLGIQPSANPGWDIEAEWRQDGGSCIGHTRWVQANSAWTETDLAYVQRVCPERLASTKPERCAPDRSTFNTQFGFNRSSSERPLLRDESPQYQ